MLFIWKVSSGRKCFKIFSIKKIEGDVCHLEVKDTEGEIWRKGEVGPGKEEENSVGDKDNSSGI